jgi:hypothetical protein
MNRNSIVIICSVLTLGSALAQGPIIVEQEKVLTGTQADAAKTAAGATGAAKVVLEEFSIEAANFAVSGGFTLLNPYKIDDGVLERNGTEAAAFVELSLLDVWAWNPQVRYRWAAENLHANGRNGWTGPHFVQKGWENLDFQGTVAYFFHGDSDQQTAATIVGAGEFSLEATVLYPVFMGLYTREKNDPFSNALDLYNRTTSAHTVGLVLAYGATTDRGAFDIHHRAFGGVGYRTAIKNPHANTKSGIKREILLGMQVGAALVESTEFVDGDSRRIRLEHGDLPAYTHNVNFGVEAEIYYPLPNTEVVNLSFKTRVYGGSDDNPNQWAASIGITAALDKLFP